MKLGDYYQVKFQVKGKMRYGVVDTFGDEAKKCSSSRGIYW